MGTLKPQSNGPLYSNTVIGTLAVDGTWAQGCNIWYGGRTPGRAAALPCPLIAVPNVTAHPSSAGVDICRCTDFILSDVALYMCAIKG